MFQRQQAGLAKFKRLLLHPAMIALCAADVVGYYVTRARLDAAVPLAPEPAYDGAGARYAPSQPLIASFALPQESMRAGLVGDQFAEPWALVPDNSAPIAQLAVIEPEKLPAADGTAFSPHPRQRALIAPVIERALYRAPKPRAAMTESHRSVERNAGLTVAAEFNRAFPAHFATKSSAVSLDVANAQAAADLASSAEPSDNAEAFAAPVAADPVEPDRRGDVTRGTELPGASNSAQLKGSISTLDPAPSDIGIDAPVDRPGAAMNSADQIEAESALVVPRLAVKAVAAVHPKVQHTAKRLSAAQPLAALSGKRAHVPGVSAIAATQRKGSLVIPQAGAAPGATISSSLSADLVPAGSNNDGHIAVRLGDLLDAFEPAMDRAAFERISRSPHTAELVTLTTLRGAGISVGYDAAERTVTAVGGVKISAAPLG